jgi:hypothetical protein
LATTKNQVILRNLKPIVLVIPTKDIGNTLFISPTSICSEGVRGLHLDLFCFVHDILVSREQE